MTRAPVILQPRGRSRALIVARVIVMSAAVLGLAACSATAPRQPQVWGSDQANLNITNANATLLIQASGGCYGSYGNFDGPLPSGTFSVAGTYTQLIGAYPGAVQHAAQFSGTVQGHELSITVTVPDAQQTIGPFTLARGVDTVWPACNYP